ncbi:MAG: phosphatidate cytidylyltransferase [Verrucomicrobiota bacterium]
MLKQRLQSGVLIGLAVLVAGLWFPLPLVAFVAVIVGCLGLIEFFKLLENAELAHHRVTGIAGGVTLLTAVWLAHTFGDFDQAMSIQIVALVGVFLAIFIRQFNAPNSINPINTMSNTLFGVVYVAFLFSFVIQLLLAWGDPSGRWLAFYLIAVVKSGDTGAYFTGSRLGRNKLIPQVSPNKTWEGCAGALALSCLVSLIFFFASGGSFGEMSFRFIDALVLGLGLPILGILSDLTESAVKRAVGAKDSSHMVQGMGGILDIIDSLLFCAPALFVYAWLFMS